MTRVVKVLWAANRNRWRSAARRRGARARSGYSGPVNLPTSGALLDGANPGIAAAMARVHSYEWLHNAVEDADEAGVRGCGRCPMDATWLGAWYWQQVALPFTHQSGVQRFAPRKPWSPTMDGGKPGLTRKCLTPSQHSGNM